VHKMKQLNVVIGKYFTKQMHLIKINWRIKKSSWKCNR